MRVLRVSGGFDRRQGGPALSTFLSIVATHGREASVEVATLDEGSASAEAVQILCEAGVTVRLFKPSRAPGARRYGVSGALSLWLLRNAGRFDLIHLHGGMMASSLIGLIAGRIHRTPVILTPHESLTQHDVVKSRFVLRMTKRVVRDLYLRFLAGVVFASELELTDTLGRRDARAFVVAHPVDLMPGPVRHQGSEALTVGFLGRFDPKKNLELLLRALPEGARLIVAGSGRHDVVDQMHVAAREAGAADRVEWLGFIGDDDKPGFFEQLDFLAMPSRFEGFGMSAAEALAYGVPVITTPTTGIAELVQRHRCGYVVSADPSALKDVLASPGDLPGLRTRARGAAEAELGMAHHGDTLIQVYRRLATTLENGAKQTAHITSRR